MIAPIVVVGVCALAVALYLLRVHLRRRRTAPELPEDWWSQFEDQFRRYAERDAAERHARHRRLDQQ